LADANILPDFSPSLKRGGNLLRSVKRNPSDRPDRFADVHRLVQDHHGACCQYAFLELEIALAGDDDGQQGAGMA
jgi:hypothetical protein